MSQPSNCAKSIFLDALELNDDRERKEFIAERCAEDGNVRLEVERLLQMHGKLNSFMEAVPKADVTIDHARPEKAGTLIGRYKLLEQIGEGGMGLVYMAEQQEPVRRLVALKLVKPGMDSKQVIARFEAERQALAMMDHPNIAKVHDAGTTDSGRPYFVMELVRGIPVNEFCDQQKLTVRQRLDLFIQVCQSVQHAHQKGIIHRDLKPTNVLVTKADTVPLPKVIDFGIAKALGASLTDHTLHTGFAQIVGTPMYMSPEQAEMNHFGVDTRSDVYSLGVLLYELLSGTTPFDKETLSKAGLDEMRRMIREDEPPRPSHRISTLSAQASSTISQQRGLDERHLGHVLRGELDWIVMKALEKDRTRRYESASALAADIQRYLSDEPVLACPPTTMYRFQKFIRKHKPAIATAAAIAICLILGTTVSAWQAARATTAEAQANANEQKAVANEAQAKQAAVAEAQQRQRAEANEQQANTQRDEVKLLYDKLAAKEQQLQKTLYAAHMNLARHAWESGDTRRADELLLQHRPKAGEPDQRSFEWHYLHRLRHSNLLMLRGHNSNVHAAVFSPDGKRLASASGDRTVKVWDAETGRELLTFKGHTAAVNSVVFSPDCKRIASCTGNQGSRIYGTPEGRGMKVWNAETGEELLHVREAYSPVVYSPDGKKLATTQWNETSSENYEGSYTVKIWDAETGRELQAWKAHNKDINHLAFSPDGKTLASEDDATAKLWDLETGRELLALKGAGHGVTFSPDGKRIVSAGRDGFAKVWDAQTGEKLLSIRGVQEFFALRPDGKHLVAGSEGGSVTFFDLQTGSEVGGIRGAGELATYSPDGRRLATFQGSRIKIWDAEKDQEGLTIRNVLYWYPAISPDGKHVAGGRGLDVIVFDAVTGKPSLTLKGHTVPVLGVAYSADGKRIVSGGNGRIWPDGSAGGSSENPAELRIWDAQTGRELLAIKANDDKDRVPAVAFSPDGKRVASPQHVWDAQTGAELFTLNISNNERGGGTTVAFSPDGRYVASGDEAGAKLWNAQTGQELRTLPGGAPGTPFCPVVAFSPDSKRLVGGGYGGTAKVWDVETGQETLTVKSGNGRFGLAFSPDGKRLASSYKVWDAETGLELLSLPDGAYGIAFSADGHRLVSNSGGRLRVFDATPLPEKP